MRYDKLLENDKTILEDLVDIVYPRDIEGNYEDQTAVACSNDELQQPQSKE